MRLYLLPVSTRRALLYCERLPLPPSQAAAASKTGAEAAGGSDQQVQTTQPQPQHQHQQSLLDKAQTRAANLWADWEKKPSGTWQHKVVTYSNVGFRRIAFEEWGLKSVPPLTKAQRNVAEGAAEAAAKAFGHEKAVGGADSGVTGAASSTKSDANKTSSTDNADNTSQEQLPPSTTPPVTFPPSPPVEVVYPSSLIPSDSVEGILHRLSTSRESLHRKRMIWSFVGMPISAPVAILPVIPNLPFFYLVYRAWSHWRAIAGGKHLQLLLQTNGLVLRPSATLDSIYAKDEAAVAVRKAGTPIQITGGPEKDGEALLLSRPGTKEVGHAFDSALLEEQLERAVWQIEKAEQAKETAAGGKQ